MQITSGREGELQVIIIDEYQDISRQRFDLARALSQICDAKIIAVGDDWQSIYAYAGSDITLFTHFAEIMGYGEELKITKTYRNSQEVIDIAGQFHPKELIPDSEITHQSQAYRFPHHLRGIFRRR